MTYRSRDGESSTAPTVSNSTSRPNRRRIPAALSALVATALLASVLVLAVPATAGAQTNEGDWRTVYVDPVNGNDGADGQTPGTAWRSLVGSVRRLQPGNILYLMNGEYRETTAYVTSSGNASAWVTITAYPGHNPAVVATRGSAIEVFGNYVEISGLTLRGEGFGPGNAYGYGVGITAGTHHVRVLNSSISGFPSSGVGAASGSHITVAGNRIFNNSWWGPEQGSGLSLFKQQNLGFGNDANGYSNYIVDNVLWGNENRVTAAMYGNPSQVTDGNAIIIDSNTETGYAGRTLIANNVVFDNGGRGINVYRSAHVDIANNTAFQNSKSGNLAGTPSEISIGQSSDVQVRSNVAWPRPGGSPLWAYGSSGVSADRNLYISDRGGDIGGPEDHVMQANPGMVNPTTDASAADFRIVFGAFTDRGAQNALHGRYSNTPASPPSGGGAPAPAPSEPSGPVVMEVGTGYSPEEWADVQWAAQSLGVSVEEFQRQGVWITAFIIGLSPLRDRPAPLASQPVVIGSYGAVTGYDEPGLQAMSVISRKHGTDLESRSQKLGTAVLTFIIGRSR